MSRSLYYTNGDGEQKKIPQIKGIEENGMFLRVEHSPMFSNDYKTTNIRKDRVIRYDE